MTQADASRTRPTSTQRTSRYWLPIVGAYLVSLLFFPVPMIAIGMLVCAALLALSIYVLWTEAQRMDPVRRATLDQRVPRVLIGVVVVGVVAAFVWPATMAVIAFGASVATCAAWFAMERTIQARSRR